MIIFNLIVSYFYDNFNRSLVALVRTIGGPEFGMWLIGQYILPCTVYVLCIKQIHSILRIQQRLKIF